MKILFTSLLFLFSSNALAVQFQVVGACSDKPAYDLAMAPKDADESVGALSLRIFTDKKIPYHGTEAGFSSILGTPEGDDAIEVISDSEMRAYGWCYHIDGKEPQLLPDEVKVSDAKNILWFYGFATYKDGDWKDYCTPAYTIKPDKICKSAPKLSR